MPVTIAMPVLLRGSVASLNRTHSARFICIATLLLWAATLASREVSAAALWIEVMEPDLNATNLWVHPTRAKVFQLAPSALQEQLASLQPEFSPATQGSGIISLPMPDGSLVRFRIWESPIMAPELAARFPEIKTYTGQGIEDPSATMRLDWTPAGLHAQILSPNGAVYIDPQRRGDSRRHVSYFKRDCRREAASFRCLTQDSREPLFEPASSITPTASGATLRTYRLAVAATGEYTQFHGGSVAAGLAAIVTAVNRVNGVFESELAIRLVLVANNDRIVFTNATTDPYSNTDLNAMLGQNQTTIDSLIGSTNYDVGHVFCTAEG